MSPLSDDQKKFIDILLKDYESMRAEIRLYIDKQYLAVIVILSLITYGLFSTNDTTRGFAFLFTPFLIAGLVGFLAMVEFFISKTAGYIRMIETRIGIIFGNNSLENEDIFEKYEISLPPIFWESFYADKGIGRDKGDQHKSLFIRWGVGLLSLAIIVMYVMVLFFGVSEAQKWQILGFPSWVSTIAYISASLVALGASVFMLRQAPTRTRNFTVELNKKLIKHSERKA